MNNENLHDLAHDEEESCQCGCGCEHDEHAEHEECGCGCDCGCEDHDHEHMVVDLEDENGNVVSCEVVDGFTYKENEYVLVQNPEDGSVYLFKVIGEGENGELVIPEDGEFEEVSKFYEESLKNE